MDLEFYRRRGAPNEGVANGKSKTHQDAETGILKSEPKTKKCSDLIEKQICDQQTQNLRLQDPLSLKIPRLG